MCGLLEYMMSSNGGFNSKGGSHDADEKKQGNEQDVLNWVSTAWIHHSGDASPFFSSVWTSKHS